MWKFFFLVECQIPAPLQEMIASARSETTRSYNYFIDTMVTPDATERFKQEIENTLGIRTNDRVIFFSSDDWLQMFEYILCRPPHAKISSISEEPIPQETTSFLKAAQERYGTNTRILKYFEGRSLRGS